MCNIRVRLLSLFIPTYITDQDTQSDVPIIRRPFSLSGNDFYPLIHIRTKWMTYDEKVAYRAKHGIPGTIDKWIADGKTRTKAPTADSDRQKRHGGPSFKNPLWQDDVECILNVIHKEVGI
jgi:hypothetical protein